MFAAWMKSWDADSAPFARNQTIEPFDADVAMTKFDPSTARRGST
jgi:hypothetical protein